MSKKEIPDAAMDAISKLHKVAKDANAEFTTAIMHNTKWDGADCFITLARKGYEKGDLLLHLAERIIANE